MSPRSPIKLTRSSLARWPMWEPLYEFANSKFFS
ncbi:MAG: hypothetical protein ACI814_004588 [Mariniblastus sp.]